MNRPSPSPQISDETLSAYLDGAVTAEERSHIDRALAHDAELSWRLESLRQTVHFLSTLPAVKTQRVFSLEAILAAEAATQRAAKAEVARSARQPAAQPAGDSVWQRLLAFWSGGSLGLRNGAMVAAALFLFVLVGAQVAPGGTQSSQQTAMAPQQAAMGDVASVADTAAAKELPADDAAVAEAPVAEAAMALVAEPPIAEPPVADAPVVESAMAAVAEAPVAETESLALADAPEMETAATDTGTSVPGSELALAVPAPRADSGGIGGAADNSALGDPALGGMGGGTGNQPQGGAVPPQALADAGMQGNGAAATGLDEAIAESLDDSNARREASPTLAAAAAAPSAEEESAETESAEPESASAESATANFLQAEAASAENAPAATTSEETTAALPAAESAAVDASLALDAGSAAADAEGTGNETESAVIASLPAENSEAAVVAPDQSAETNLVPVAAATSDLALASGTPWLLYAQIALAAVALLLALLWLRSRRST